jgi:hypothetical protein
VDSILSALKDLLTNVKNLSLPGIFAAFGFVLLLWPPQVIDVVNDVTVNSDYAGDMWPKTQDGLKDYAGRIDPVCNTFPKARERALPNPQSFEESKSVALANQFNLERIARTLSECSEKEKALSGFEDSEIVAGNAEIDVLRKERDGIQDIYLGYEKTANPLAGIFKGRLKAAEDKIRDKQADVRKLEQLKRERDRRIGELDRLNKDVVARLAEPGRLRPKEKFDDFLASLSNHIIAFLALALGWSILFEPINRALFGLVYDSAFRHHLDLLYPMRNPSDPGESDAPSDSDLGYAYFLALLLAVAIFIGYFFSYRPSISSSSQPCNLVQPVDCGTFMTAGPPLSKLLLGCLVWTLAGLLISVIVSWIWIRISHEIEKRKRLQARKRVAGMIFQALAPAMVQLLRGKSIESKSEPQPASEAPVEKPSDCEKQLKTLWKKISQPEYAIGQGLLSRDDYNSIKDEYYGQSQISIGLIPPVAFLTFAILATPQVGLRSGWPVWTTLALVQALLLYVGVDRRHKFETTVESLIASQFLKTCEAKQKKPTPPPGPQSKLNDLIKDQLKTLLKGAKISDSTLEIILPSDEPTATASDQSTDESPQEPSGSSA